MTPGLIAVDDGSSDRTREVLEQLARRRDRLVVEAHERNGGYGAALRTGAEAAHRLGLDWVLFMDSDLTNPPSDIPRFADLIDGPVDYIKASRFEPGGSMSGVPSRRRFLSVAANRVSRLVAGRGVSDPTNGFRAIRTDAFLKMPLVERGFAIIMEELVWALRLRLRCVEPPDGPHDPRRVPATYFLWLHAHRSSGATGAIPSPSLPTVSAMEAARADTTTPFACRACGAPDLELMIDFGELPLAGGFLDGAEEAAKEQRYPLVVHVCRNCALVQIVEPVDPDVLFQDYSFSASTIPGLVRHFEDYAQWLVDRHRPEFVVEFGCNDGVLLSPLERLGVRAVGVDISANITELARERGHTAITGAFTPAVAEEIREEHGPADVVTGSNVFAHNADPETILEAARDVLKPGGVLALEFMYAGDLYEQVQWDTLYHEHLTFYALGTISRLLERNGFRAVHAERIPMHGGSLRLDRLDGRVGRCRTRRSVSCSSYEEQDGDRLAGALDGVRRRRATNDRRRHRRSRSARAVRPGSGPTAPPARRRCG